jgi:hypothetical protein
MKNNFTTAEQILKSKEFTDDDGQTGWTEQQVLNAMTEYAVKFGAWYSGMEEKKVRHALVRFETEQLSPTADKQIKCQCKGPFESARCVKNCDLT